MPMRHAILAATLAARALMFGSSRQSRARVRAQRVTESRHSRTCTPLVPTAVILELDQGVGGPLLPRGYKGLDTLNFDGGITT